MYVYIYISIPASLGKLIKIRNIGLSKSYRPGGSSSEALGYGLDGPGSITGNGGVKNLFTPLCPVWF